MNIIYGILVALAAGTQAAETSISSKLSKQADIVLRVFTEVPGNGACDKYCWPELKIIRILKNKSNEKLTAGGKIRVAFLNTSRPFPVGEFTVYLERYNKDNGTLWKVLAGDTQKGMSHVVLSKKPRTDCPKGTHPFTGLIGPGCCKDGAVCD